MGKNNKKEIDRPYLDVGQRVYYIRKLNDLTQTEFAEKFFVSQDLVSAIERGIKPLIEQNRKMLCHVFGVNEDWILTGEGDIYQSITKNLSIKDKEIERVIGKLIQLDHDDILFIESILDKYIENLKNKNLQ